MISTEQKCCKASKASASYSHMRGAQKMLHMPTRKSDSEPPTCLSTCAAQP